MLEVFWVKLGKNGLKFLNNEEIRATAEMLRNSFFLSIQKTYTKFKYKTSMNTKQRTGLRIEKKFLFLL